MKPASRLFRSTKTSLIIGLMALCSHQAFTQTFCDSIVVDKIQYFAFDPNAIEVSAMTITNDCVSYPSFILYDQNGDTLATEMVNFFCLGLGGLQSHFLSVNSGANIPPSPFNGTLELWSGFGGQLVCTWNMSIDLCPSDSCSQAEIYITNTDTLEAGNVYWYVNDSIGNTFGSGVITMDLNSHTHFDTIPCLPPGNYQLWVSPFSDIWIDEDYILGVTTSYLTSVGTNTALAGSPDPMLLHFGFYEECFDLTNSIDEPEEPTFELLQTEDRLTIRSVDGAIGTIDLVDMQGRLLISQRSDSPQMEISTNGLSSGVYIVRNISPEFRIGVERIFIR